MASKIVRYILGYDRLPKNVRVHTRFEHWARRTPNAPALFTEEQVVTYRELDERANRLAWFLKEQGIGPGAVVLTCFYRSVEMVIAQLAVLKTGGAYLPVEPDIPAARIGFMIADCNPRLALTQQTSRAALNGADLRVVCLDTEWPPMAEAYSQAQLRHEGEGLACLIYTSGSTGRPKGVLTTHHGIVRLVTKQSYVNFHPSQRFLLLASPGFDAVLFELWAPLMTGGSCVIFEGGWVELPRLETLIRNYRISCLFLTTSLFNHVIDERPELLETVADVLVGGEALSPAHVLRARARLPGVRLSNVYGPTECTTFACAGVIREPTMWGCESVPIGRSLRHTECYLVDEHMRPVPDGDPGELLLGGSGLAMGYLNQPALTAEKFIPHPWSKDRKARLYRTGDLCRMLPNGALEFVSRMDDQIKLRGYRIELGEVETVARECAGVAQAVAVVSRGAGERKQLILFCTAKPQEILEAENVRQELRRRLLDKMVPAHIVIAERIPWTASGKIDRATLLQGWEKGQPSDKNAKTGAGIENPLVECWRRVLQRSELGVDANFFDAGGDSLLAMQLALEVQRELGRPVLVGAIFTYPTPGTLAAHLSQETVLPALQGEGSGPPLFYVPEIHGIGRLPLYLVQKLHGKRRYCETLQFPGVDGGQPCERVEDMAAVLVSQLKAAYPNGPLCLYGFSFGGLVAYDMARQLRSEGRKVNLVVLGDIVPAASYVPRGLAEQVALRLVDLLRPPWRAAPRKLWTLFRLMRDQFTGCEPKTAYSILCRTMVARASHRAYNAYEPPDYTGSVALVKCDQSHSSLSPYTRPPDKRDYGWSRYIKGPFTVRRVPGPHDQMFSDEVCDIIDGLLDEYAPFAQIDETQPG